MARKSYFVISVFFSCVPKAEWMEIQLETLSKKCDKPPPLDRNHPVNLEILRLLRHLLSLNWFLKFSTPVSDNYREIVFRHSLDAGSTASVLEA